MTANTSLLLSNPDFASIRSGLQTFLQSQTRFKDYNFAGSNLSVVLDLLAYNSYQDAFTTSMLASEMFLDTAQLRPSMVSHAKELGYTPRSTTSSKAVISVQVFPGDSPGALTIPIGQTFPTTVGTRSFTFQTVKPYLIVPANGVYIAPNVEIYEGFLITDIFTVSGAIPQQRYTLSNQNADTSLLTVTVNGIPFTQAGSFVDIGPSSQVFFVQLNSISNKYEIYFGDNVFGVTPNHSATIKATYGVSTGDASNGANIFTSASPINGYANITITTVAAASGGAPAESTESIRRNAPLMFQTRNRGITTTDYRSLLMNRFPEIESVNVYGGDEVTPPQFGRVFICTNVEGTVGVQAAAKARYYQYVKDRAPLTITPVFVDPIPVSLILNSNIFYDYINYSVSASDISTSVLAAVQAFNDTFLSSFNTTFAYSQLIAAIDKSNSAILSNDSSIHIALSVDPVAVQQTVQLALFRNALATKVPSIMSTLFTFNNKICMLTDDIVGDLIIATDLGNPVPTTVQKIGAIDYDNGIVTIQPFVFQSLQGPTLTLYAQPRSKNITASQNMILSIDLTNIVINPVPTKPQ
jgi:hypothetical protein